MTEAEKTQVWERYKVMIGKGRFGDKSKCAIKRCLKHPHYLIFVGHRTALSTLSFNCCRHHLPECIDRAFLEQKESAEAEIKRIEEYDRNKAIELLNTSLH